MDNKQDRQFLSKVKNFMGNSNSFSFSEKSDPVLNSIKNIVEKNQNTTKSKYQSDIGNLDAINKEISTVKPSLFGIKNLNEYTQTQDTINRQRQEREASLQRARERNAAENERLAQTKADVKRRREEDEALQYREEIDELEMGRDGNPNLPADTPENRKKMAEWRRAKADERQAEYMASRVAELSGKKPEELTAKEAGELSLMKSMTQGKVATKGLEGNIQRKLEAKAKVSPLALEPTAGTDNTGRTQEQIDMDAMAAGKPSVDDAAKRREVAKGQLSRTLGRSQEELVGLTQTAVGREAEQKQAADAQYREQMQARRIKEREGQRIQGTNMTYGEFKQQAGREYDATSKEDSSLAIKIGSQSSAGRYGTEQARQAALSADQMNRAYGQQNQQMAQRAGQLERQVDRSQMELDRFRNDPQYRQQVVQGEIANTQAQPGFVQNVARSMGRSVKSAEDKKAFQARASQPAKIGTPSLLAKPQQTLKAPTMAPTMIQRDVSVTGAEPPALLQAPINQPAKGPAAPLMLQSDQALTPPNLLAAPEGTAPSSLQRNVRPARSLSQAISSVLGKNK